MVNKDKAVELLTAVKNTLERENNSGTINDTLWYTPTETLFDFIDKAIAELTKESDVELSQDLVESEYVGLLKKAKQEHLAYSSTIRGQQGTVWDDPQFHLVYEAMQLGYTIGKSTSQSSPNKALSESTS